MSNMSYMNLDLGDTKTQLVIIIVLLLLFAGIYLFVYKNDSLEGFATYNVLQNETVKLPNLNSVIVGTGDDRSALTFNDSLSSLNVISDLNTSVDTIKNKINIIQNSFDNLLPDLTIIAYYGMLVPDGWQLCDGDILIAQDGKVVYGLNRNTFSTPNLQGRVVVGSSAVNTGNTPPLPDSNNNKLSSYYVGDYGGEERHTLTMTEMPRHRHNIGYTDYTWNNYPNRQSYGGLRYDDYYEKDAASPIQIDDRTKNRQNDGGNSKGGTDPHYNMQPYYTLMYIIKKPKLGGPDNLVKSISPIPTSRKDLPKTNPPLPSATVPLPTNAPNSLLPPS